MKSIVINGKEWLIGIDLATGKDKTANIPNVTNKNNQ